MAVADTFGTLHLLPVWLGDSGGVEQLPLETIAIAERVTLYFAEHEKTARHMLRRMVPGIDLSKLEIHRLDKDSTPRDAEGMIALMRGGRHAAIVSEAGMPGIADPGALLVGAAHRAGVTVLPLIGPSSLFLALAASGLNGQAFTFLGYLPVKPLERKAAIKKLESDALRSGAAQLFIETPYRNDSLFGDLLATCAGSTLLTIAIDLTQPGGQVITRTIAAWKKAPMDLGKRPAVFILGVQPR